MKLARSISLSSFVAALALSGCGSNSSSGGSASSASAGGDGSGGASTSTTSSAGGGPGVATSTSSSGGGVATSTSTSGGGGSAGAPSSSSGTGGAGGASAGTTSGAGGGNGGAPTSSSSSASASSGDTSAASTGSSTSSSSSATTTSSSSSASTGTSGGPLDCTIGGQTYAAESVEAGSPCQVCNPALSATTWSSAPDGLGCGPGSVCASGVCGDPSPTTCNVHVPGDYATVQAAITSLRNAGQAATVCVAAGTYDENLTVNYSRAALTVVGESAAKVILSGTVNVPAPSQDAYLGYSPGMMTFKDMTLDGVVTAGSSLSLLGCVVKGSVSLTEPDMFYDPAPSMTFLIDSTDISWPSVALTVTLLEPPGGTLIPMNVTVQNSFIHDAYSGIYVRCNDSSADCQDASVVVTNNTLTNNTLGITLDAAIFQGFTTRWANNLIMGSTTAIDTLRTPAPWDDFHDNALFGNTTNYANQAAPGSGYVTSDPKVVPTAPPTPGPGSPLVGAGDATLLTTSDFFGVARHGRADIGAVEGP